MANSQASKASPTPCSDTLSTSQVAKKNPLQPVPQLPFDVEQFAARGWVSVPIRSVKPKLYEAYQCLLERMYEFFDMPTEEKMKFHVPARMQTSEEGFSVVEGEKMLFTVRRGNHCPQVLKKEAQTVWTEGGAWLEEIMQGIALSLGLPEKKFEPLVRPCVETLREKDRTATLLRLFRYIRPQDTKPNVVSEGHRDLGLITLVVGHSPGLEAWDPGVNGGKGGWVSVEELKHGDVPELSATLLSGQTLVRLSNNQYQAARHRVLVHPPSETFPSPYRFSLVHALRAHWPVIISSSEYTTPVTGDFLYPFGIDEEVRMGAMSQAIADAHFNVNIDRDLREEQMKAVQARRLNLHHQHVQEDLWKSYPMKQENNRNVRALLRKASTLFCYRPALV